MKIIAIETYPDRAEEKGDAGHADPDSQVAAAGDAPDWRAQGYWLELASLEAPAA